MNNRNVFLEKELPYQKLALVGLEKDKVLSMPKEVLAPLLSGKISPLLMANVQTENGTVDVPMKLQLYRDKNGTAQVMTYPVQKEIPNDLRLSLYETNKLQQGEIIKKPIDEDGTRRLKFLQLDPETNNIMKRDVSVVKMQEQLKSIEKINDIQLGANQKQAALEGKPIELTVGDQKISVGVDLKQPTGFKVVQGDMREWEKQQKIKYDEATPGYMGYVQTDKNRWEYTQIIDKATMHKVRKESISETRSAGMKL